MALIRPPVCRPDQVQPFSPDQLDALLAAARRTQNARRDEAIVTLFLDTGVRVSELCALRHRDLTERRITVAGKGDKRRTVYFGQRTTKALWAHLRDKEDAGDDPLFPSERAGGKGEHLSRYGVRDLIERLGKAAGVRGVRCSSHTFRHTFAVSFLRAGGQIKMLMEILGHTDAQMTSRYVKLAEADLANQRRFSPADQLRARGEDGRIPTWSKDKSTKGKGAKSTPKGSVRGEQTVEGEGRGSNVRKITRAKLTEDEVRAIKAALAVRDGRGVGEKRAEVAARYGVAVSTVKEIALGYSWQHVGPACVELEDV